MNVLVTIIDVLFTAGLICNAFLFIPQIMRLLQKKHADDLSLLTFAGFNAINLLMVLHGLFHEDNMLMFGSILSLITNTAVTALIIWYRYYPKPTSHHSE